MPVLKWLVESVILVTARKCVALLPELLSLCLMILFLMKPTGYARGFLHMSGEKFNITETPIVLSSDVENNHLVGVDYLNRKQNHGRLVTKDGEWLYCLDIKDCSFVIITCVLMDLTSLLTEHIIRRYQWRTRASINKVALYSKLLVVPFGAAALSLFRLVQVTMKESVDLMSYDGYRYIEKFSWLMKIALNGCSVMLLLYSHRVLKRSWQLLVIAESVYLCTLIVSFIKEYRNLEESIYVDLGHSLVYALEITVKAVTELRGLRHHVRIVAIPVLFFLNCEMMFWIILTGYSLFFSHDWLVSAVSAAVVTNVIIRMMIMKSLLDGRIAALRARAAVVGGVANGVCDYMESLNEAIKDLAVALY